MRRCVLVLTGVLIVTATARGAEVYSTIGPGSSFRTDAAWGVWGPAATFITPQGPVVVGNQDIAAPFTVGPGQDYSLVSATLALAHSGKSDSLTVRLFSDSAGLPGANLASTAVINVPASPTLMSADFSSANVTLEAGKAYWLVADANADSTIQWQWTSTDVTGFGAWIPRQRALH
jgi:hypothetical protein